MTSCRAPRDRERWLSAVLIVAAIAAVSAVIVRWPLPPPPAVPQLASRPVPLVHLPLRPIPAVPRVDLSWPVVTQAAAPAAGDAAVPGNPAVAAPPDERPLPAREPAAGADAAAILPPLASGRLHVPADVLPSGPVAPVGAPPAAPSAQPGLVDTPAVAVTRVVTVAGRGILIGLRATGAMLRAAF